MQRCEADITELLGESITEWRQKSSNPSFKAADDKSSLCKFYARGTVLRDAVDYLPFSRQPWEVDVIMTSISLMEQKQELQSFGRNLPVLCGS